LSGIERVQFGNELLGCHHPVCILDDAGHLVPVQVAVEADAQPTPVPDVGRHEEPVRLLHYEGSLDAGWSGAPDGQATVAVVVVEVRGERLLAVHEPCGCAVAETFRHLRQGEAHRPEAGEDVVGHGPGVCQPRQW